MLYSEEFDWRQYLVEEKDGTFSAEKNIYDHPEANFTIDSYYEFPISIKKTHIFFLLVRVFWFIFICVLFNKFEQSVTYKWHLSHI